MRTVLLVEDSKLMRVDREHTLKRAGYHVVTAVDGMEALSVAQTSHPDLILLDMMLPKLDGPSVLRALKADPLTAQIPVVVVTVLDQQGKATLLGADEYIVKPVDRNILLTAIERCLKSRGGSEGTGEILVVEDDVANCEFVAEVLSSRGYVVKTAADGERARAHVKASLPRLVILDLILPKVSGLQLIADWRSDPRTADVPVFVLTNKELTQDEKEYLRANTEALFSKQEPWLDAFIEQIRRAAPLKSDGDI